MRRYLPILLIPALSLLSLWAVSCQPYSRDDLPIGLNDLAPVVLDLTLTYDLVKPPDMLMVSPDGGATDGGAIDGVPNG